MGRRRRHTQHTGSENKREMTIFERATLEKSIRRWNRGIARQQARDRRHASYSGHEHPDGKAAKRRRRQIAEGRLKAANGLVSRRVPPVSQQTVDGTLRL